MSYTEILNQSAAQYRRQFFLLAVLVGVCLLALVVTGFFDASRFILFPAVAPPETAVKL
jgi:hypothetical protein